MDDELIIKAFESIGIPRMQTIIYLDLLKNKESSATLVSKRTKMHRANVYDTLTKLKERNLVFLSTKDGKQVFAALPTELIVNEEKEKLDNLKSVLEYIKTTYVVNNVPKVSLIEKGVIGSCYKFSDLSVYMVKKSEFDINEIDSINKLEETEFAVFFNQTKFKEVLSEIQHYANVPVTSATRELYNEYSIDINKLKLEPDNTIIKRNNLIYYYTIIPLIVLIIIILVVLLRKRKNASA